MSVGIMCRKWFYRQTPLGNTGSNRVEPASLQCFSKPLACFCTLWFPKGSFWGTAFPKLT